MTASLAVAAEVRAEMARRQMTATEIARQLHRSRAFMSRRLNGEVPFDVAELEEIAKILGLPANHFFAKAAAAVVPAPREMSHAPHLAPPAAAAA